MRFTPHATGPIVTELVRAVASAARALGCAQRAYVLASHAGRGWAVRWFTAQTVAALAGARVDAADTMSRLAAAGAAGGAGSGVPPGPDAVLAAAASDSSPPPGVVVACAPMVRAVDEVMSVASGRVAALVAAAEPSVEEVVAAASGVMQAKVRARGAMCGGGRHLYAVARVPVRVHTMGHGVTKFVRQPVRALSVTLCNNLCVCVCVCWIVVQSVMLCV